MMELRGPTTRHSFNDDASHDIAELYEYLEHQKAVSGERYQEWQLEICPTPKAEVPRCTTYMLVAR